MQRRRRCYINCLLGLYYTLKFTHISLQPGCTRAAAQTVWHIILKQALKYSLLLCKFVPPWSGFHYFIWALSWQGMWIILTGPVWGLFNLSPWFGVFLEQEGRRKSLWASDVNQGLGPHWLVSSTGDEARSNVAVGKKKAESYQSCTAGLRLPWRLLRLRVHQPVSTLTHIKLVWDEASRGLCSGADKHDVCVFFFITPLLCVCEGRDSDDFRQVC